MPCTFGDVTGDSGFLAAVEKLDRSRGDKAVKAHALWTVRFILGKHDGRLALPESAENCCNYFSLLLFFLAEQSIAHYQAIRYALLQSDTRKLNNVLNFVHW